MGIVVGLAAEARIARRLGWPVAIGGGTSVGAELAARRLVDDGAEALVSFGLAGGLDPALPAGMLLVPSAVIAGGSHYATDPVLSRCFGGATPHVVLGGDTILAGVDDKHRLLRMTGASAIDLESGPVARIAGANGLPFAVLRAICDPAGRALPAAALAALDAHGAIAIWRVLAALAMHPGQLPGMLLLAVDAARAHRALARRIRSLVPPWPAAGQACSL